MQRSFKNFNFLQIFTLIVLFGMVIFAVIITKNVNKEFKIRELAGNLQKYKYSALSFNNIYNGLPGDVDKATFYWKEVTSDGNNDRKISFEEGEGILAWQHLQLAKLLESPVKLSGKWKAEKPQWMIADYNSPFDKRHKAVFYFNYNEEEDFNYIGYSGLPNKSGITTTPALTPEEAMRLDLMVDDGYPETGILRAEKQENSTCYLSGEYKEESELAECAFAFRI